MRLASSLRLLLTATAWVFIVHTASLPTTKETETVSRLQRRFPPEPKYFHEEHTDIHYDSRFGDSFLEEDEKKATMVALVQSYLSTMRDIKVQTWLMHGTLLGWWWGKKVMPWDPDADVSVSEADMYFLGAYYNMTVFYFKYGDMTKGKHFLLEVNPYFKHRGQDDILNVIDARWLDMETGLYVDITAWRYFEHHDMGKGMMYDKYDHQMRDTFVFPLLDTVFEGVPAKIPYGYKAMLKDEYGEESLTKKHWNKHMFDEKAMQWVPDGQIHFD